MEELATKAELQELRNQLNEAFGQKEGGGKDEVFKAGAPLAGGLIQGAGTVYLATKIRAGNALTDIVLDSSGNSPIWKELEKGTAKLNGFTGNGAKKSLSGFTNVTKTVGSNSGAAVSTVAVASKAAAATAVLANLVSIAASLALNIATVKVFDSRIEAEAKGTQLQLDAVNNSMLRLYNKNQGDISQANQEIESNRLAIEAANNVIQANEAGIQQARDDNFKLSNQIKQAEEKASQLQSQLTSTKNLINENTADFQFSSRCGGCSYFF